jgi:hypothetical protein
MAYGWLWRNQALARGTNVQHDFHVKAWLWNQKRKAWQYSDAMSALAKRK